VARPDTMDEIVAESTARSNPPGRLRAARGQVLSARTLETLPPCKRSCCQNPEKVMRRARICIPLDTLKVFRAIMALILLP
jgi:hypothetical protein